MMTKKARLGKQIESSMDKELKISVKSLLLIFFLVILFFTFAFAFVPQTYGFL